MSETNSQLEWITPELVCTDVINSTLAGIGGGADAFAGADS